jgi:hypothetical protein
VITNVLIEHPWLSPSALLLLIAVGPLLCRWSVPRPRLAWSFAGLSLVPVVLLTLAPVDRDVFERCAMQWALPTPGRVELMANVVLFVTPVMLTGVALRRPGLAALLGCGLSASLELMQAMVPAIGRSCDTNDWLSNSVGSGIGAAIAWWGLRWARSHPSQPVVSGSTR